MQTPNQTKLRTKLERRMQIVQSRRARQRGGRHPWKSRREGERERARIDAARPHVAFADVRVRRRPTHSPSMACSKIFEHYESEYLSSARTAAQDIEQINNLLPGIERDTIVKRTQASIEQAGEICSQMELEARSLQGAERQQLIAQAIPAHALCASIAPSSRTHAPARARLHRRETTNPASRRYGRS